MKHIPVLTQEVIQFLAPQKNENFIDATCGLGGHSKLILEKIAPHGKLLAIDQDEIALDKAKENLSVFSDRVSFSNNNFSKIGLIVRDWPVSRIDGILFDLGVSSYQLETAERGFSFNLDAPLDMRMSLDAKLTAKDILNRWDAHSIKKILQEFGEEPFAGKIAQEIIKAREIHPIAKTDELVEIVKRAMPPKYRFSREKHFATSTFRALRMAVNDELNVLQSGLKQAIQILSPGGRIVVISFHSLEDRIVKTAFAENPKLSILTKKPIIAQTEEIGKNPKARSAKLRAAIKEV